MTAPRIFGLIEPTPKALAAYFDKEADSVLRMIQTHRPDDWQNSPTMHAVRIWRDTADMLRELERYRSEAPK